MQLIRPNWIRLDLVRINASTEDAHQFFDATRVALSNHIAVHGYVLLKEAHFIVHVGEKTTDFSSQVDHMSWFDSLKKTCDRLSISQVAIFTTSCKVELAGGNNRLQKRYQAVSVLSFTEIALSFLQGDFWLGKALVLKLLHKLLNTVANHTI